MLVRRSFQRALRDLLGGTGDTVGFDQLGETLQPVVQIASAEQLVPPTYENYEIISYGRNPAAVNFAVLAYQAPAGGAIIRLIGSPASTDLTVFTTAAGEFPVLVTQGVIRRTPLTGGLRGNLQNGDVAQAAIIPGFNMNGPTNIPPILWPLSEGRWFAVTTLAVDVIIDVGFAVQEFPDEGRA